MRPSSALPAKATVQIAHAYSGHNVWCWWGRNGNHRWNEVVPDGKRWRATRPAWCKVYIDFPMYLEEFTVVAPNGARQTYKPA